MKSKSTLKRARFASLANAKRLGLCLTLTISWLGIAPSTSRAQDYELCLSVPDAQKALEQLEVHGDLVKLNADRKTQHQHRSVEATERGAQSELCQKAFAEVTAARSIDQKRITALRRQKKITRLGLPIAIAVGIGAGLAVGLAIP